MLQEKFAKNTFWIGVACLFVAHLPFLILGESSYIMIHDNLDSELVYMQMLKLSNNLIGSSENGIVENVFNGIHRDFFHSEFNVIRLLFYFLPPFWAYVMNSLIIRIFGLLGIFLLARDHFKSPNQWNTFFIAVFFACLPLHSLYGLCVMGQPLLLWSFLNLKASQKRGLSFAFIGLFAFYVHFVMIGPFALIVLVLLGLYYQLIVKESVPRIYWLGILILMLLLMLANFSMIKNFFVAHEPYQKDEWKFFIPDFISSIKRYITVFTNGTMHILHGSILPIFALLLYASYKRTPVFKSARILMIFIMGIIAFFVFYRMLTVPLEDYIQVITAFNFSRFIFLIPFIYTLILLIINQEKKLSSVVLMVLILVYGISGIYKNTELKINFARILLPEKHTAEHWSFESFYAPQLYEEIGNFISKPKDSYRVVSLGVQPCIAQYNGFHTLDSYQNLYPLSYKNDFREIIAGELDKNSDFKTFWDNHGTNMCYVISSELIDNCFFNCTKKQENEIRDLDIYTNKLREMNAQYLFSALPILNADELGLQLEKVFEDEIAKWKIHLYRL